MRLYWTFVLIWKKYNIKTLIDVCAQGVLLSGPPGTGKTLFARTLSKESGLPFVFASGAEFTDSEKSGAARINEMFSIARRNVSIHLFKIWKSNNSCIRVD